MRITSCQNPLCKKFLYIGDLYVSHVNKTNSSLTINYQYSKSRNFNKYKIFPSFLTALSPSNYINDKVIILININIFFLN